MIDIWWYGQSCFKIKGKSATVVCDPYDPEYTGLGQLKLEADIVCVSHGHEDHNNSKVVKGTEETQDPFVVFGPGEYEKSGVNIVGVASFHDEKEGQERGKNTIYNITIDEVNFVHLGDLGQSKLSQEQIESLSSCDVLFIPVGGTYTIDAKAAPDIIAQLEPKIVVPMHYKIDKLKFPLNDVGDFLKQMGKENVETLPKLSVSRDKFPEETNVVVLQAQ